MNSINVSTISMRSQVHIICETGHWVAGDEKYNVEAQAKIIALTNAYYKAVTKAEKNAISAQATAVRTAEGAKQSVVTPLQFQAAEITKIVVQGTSKGYADEKEWKQALQKVGIQAPDSKREIVGDTSSSGGSTINYSTVSKVTIGRTSLRVKVDSSTTHTADNKFIDRASASLAMKYKVTQNEYLFIAEMDLKSVEKSLYILDAMIANKGKATKEILNDKTLSVKGVQTLFEINYGIGLSMWQAEKLYHQEVEIPKMAEAWGLLGIKAITGGGGYSIERKSSTPSKVEVPSPKKLTPSKIEAVGESSKYTKGYDVTPLKSTYQERLNQTPVNNGRWTGERGESTFISDSPEVKPYIDAAGVTGVKYKNAIPDLSPFSMAEFEIKGMSASRTSNFSKADELLAKQWSTPEKQWTKAEVAKWRTQNKYTWHELNDGTSIQLVPSSINSKYGHLGGVSEVK